MFAKPQHEHEWLNFLLGDWLQEGECITSPEKPPEKHSSRVTSRSLSGMWMILEFTSDSPEGEPMTCIMTLGYDPRTSRYIGTFIGSMMTHLWIYNGQIDEKGRLVLDTEGPKFEGTGLTRYQDIIERVNDNEWTLSSQLLGDDGQWFPFMKATNTRNQ